MMTVLGAIIFPLLSRFSSIALDQQQLWPLMTRHEGSSDRIAGFLWCPDRSSASCYLVREIVNYYDE